MTSSAMNCLQCPHGAALTAMRLKPRSPCQAAFAMRNCSACTECCNGSLGNSRFTPTYSRPDLPRPMALHIAHRNLPHAGPSLPCIFCPQQQNFAFEDPKYVSRMPLSEVLHGMSCLSLEVS